MARALSDPDNEEAEFGVIVRSELKGGGLGLLLMRKLVDYQRSHGTVRLVANVLDHNDRMLNLAHELGFQEASSELNDDGTTCITLQLT